VTSNRLDFGGDPDHCADTGIIKGILPFLWMGSIAQILLLTQEIVSEFL